MADPKTPDDETVKAMAAEDARNVVRTMRADWGESEQPTMLLLRGYGDTAFQRRAEAAADWPPSLVATYLDDFCDSLADENVVYVVGILGGAYVVDGRWEHPEHRAGQVNYSGNPHAGWTLRD